MFSQTFFLSSCIEQKQYSDIPHIEFKNFSLTQNSSGIDQTGYLILEFTDGDGNIGLEQGDTLPPYNLDGGHYYNFFVELYQKVNGNFEKIEIPYNSRIPNINPEGIDRDLKGEIEIEIDVSLFSLAVSSDTIKMDAWILDRDFNRSNTISTPEIVLNLN